MVLVGQVQREIVGLINAHGPFAVGLSGEDANLFTAEQHAPRWSTASRSTSAWSATSSRSSPASSRAWWPTAASRSSPASPAARDGEVYNVNADTAAAALAVALGAEKLVVLTDVEGLYADWPGDSDRTRHQPASPPTSWRRCCPTLSSGMVPKMEACLRAVRGGVPQAHVIDGRVPHALLVEVFTDEGVGTDGARMTDAYDALAARWRLR